MLDGIANRFEMMRSRRRSHELRHQSLQAVLEWSCPPESGLRTPLGMLSILNGSWPLDAAEAILGSAALEQVDCLLERSLIRISDANETAVRFTMLESVRDFAKACICDELLREAELRRYRYYFALARDAASRYDHEPLETCRILDLEHANILAAFEYGCQMTGDVLMETVCEVRRIRFLWKVRGRKSAVDACNARLATRVDEGFRGLLLAIVLESAGEHALLSADYQAAIGYLRRSVETAEVLGDRGQRISSLIKLAEAHERSGEWDQAVECFEQALDEEQSFEDFHFTLAHLAGMYLDNMKQVDKAEPLYHRMLEAWSNHPNGEGHVAVMRRCLGTCALMRGDFEAAEGLIRLAIPVFESTGQTFREGEAWRYLAQCLAALGRNQEAELASATAERLSPAGYMA
jgi:tetratricopeptide (TPR) repeat protein